MSTKAYEGVRFRARTLSALVQDLTDAFKEFDHMAERHEVRFVAEEAARNHDADWLAWKQDTTGAIGEPGPFGQYVSRAWREMKKRQQEVRATRRRDPDVDSMVEIQVWLGPGSYFYGYVHSEVKGVREHLMASGRADDYAYWNNSDRDEAVTAARWRRRGQVWDQLLDGKCGKSFQFMSPEHDWPDKDAVMASLPDRRTRSRLLCEELMYPVWERETAAAQVNAGDLGSTAMRFLRECKRDSGPWKDRFDARAAEIEAQLPALVLV